MIKMKREGVFSLAISLCFLVTPVYAKKSTDEDKINKYLVHAGYPQEIIDEFESEQKDEIYKNKLIYVSHKKTKGHLSEKKGKKADEVSELSSDFDNFTSTLVASKLSTSTSGKIEYYLDYNWTWDYDPYFFYVDKFAMAWDDGWSYDSNSATYSYRAYGIRNETTTSKTIESGSGVNEAAPGTGVGWQYDIVDNFKGTDGNTYFIYKHKGWGRIKIYRYSDKSGNYDSSNAVGSYFHKEGFSTGGLQFNATPYISIGASSSYEKAPDTPEDWSWQNVK